MSNLYYSVFSAFKQDIEKYAEEIFLRPLSFTQVNRLAMLAASVAERCADQELYAAWNIIHGYRFLNRLDLDIQVVDAWLNRNKPGERSSNGAADAKQLRGRTGR